MIIDNIQYNISEDANATGYRLHWWLVVQPDRHIVGVYGSALESDATAAAKAQGTDPILIAGYGKPYGCGDRLP